MLVLRCHPYNSPRAWKCADFDLVIVRKTTMPSTFTTPATSHLELLESLDGLAGTGKDTENVESDLRRVLLAPCPGIDT